MILTSNVGADLIKRGTSLGFGVQRDDAENEEDAYKAMRKKVVVEMERMFRPEFRNRLDGFVIFRALSKEEIKEIVTLLLDQVQERLAEQDLFLTVTEAAKDLIAAEGYDPDFGARPLRRVIQNKIEDTLSESILAGKCSLGDTVEVDVEGEEFVIQVIGAPEKEAEIAPLPAMM